MLMMGTGRRDPRIMMQFGTEKKDGTEAQRSRSAGHLGYGSTHFEAG